MANIPLFNNGMHGPAPGGGQQPVLQPSKRIQVDPSGAFAAAREATMQPLMPKDMYAGDAVAGQAWGEALQTLGKIGAELYEGMAKVKFRKDVMTADSVMETTTGSYMANVPKNQNPDTWVSDYDATVPQALEKALFEGKNLSSRAEEEIRLRLQLHLAQTRTSLQAGAVRESVTQTRQLYQAKDDRLPKTDVPGRMALLNEQRREGVISEPDANSQEWTIKQQGKLSQLENLVATKPKEVVDLLRQPEKWPQFGLNAVTAPQAQRSAEAAVAVREGQAVIAFKSLVSDGHDPEEALQVVAPDLTPLVHGTLKDNIAQKRLQNDPVNYEKRFTEIAGYSKEDDPTGFRLAELKTKIGLDFDGEYETQLLSRLTERAEKTTPTDALDISFQEALGSINEMLEDGDFGVWKRVYDGKNNIFWDEGRESWMRKRDTWEEPGDPVRIRLDQVTSQQMTLGVLGQGAVIEDLDAKEKASRRAAKYRTLAEKRKSEDKYKTALEMMDDITLMLAGDAANAAKLRLPTRSVGDAPAQGASPLLPAPPTPAQLEVLVKKYGTSTGK